jgi:hypothetical protein
MVDVERAAPEYRGGSNSLRGKEDGSAIGGASGTTQVLVSTMRPLWWSLLPPTNPPHSFTALHRAPKKGSALLSPSPLLGPAPVVL